MKCPHCVDEVLLESVNIGSVDVNTCASCGGVWFDHDELRKVKDESLPSATWFDFDLWKSLDLFKTEEGTRVCPRDGSYLHTLTYGGSDIEIDACRECHGIWLDKGELAKIVDYVKQQSEYEVLSNYFSNVIREGKEVATGPEGFRSELADLMMLTHLFKYKFLVQHPTLAHIFTYWLPLT